MQVETANIDDVVRVAEMIDKYGALLVGTAILFVVAFLAIIILMSVFVSQSKSKDKQHQAMLTDMMKQNNDFCNLLLTEAKGESKPDTSLLTVSMNCGNVIDGHLRYLIGVTKADRVAVYIFHNGQRMLNGGHLLKFSCLEEYAQLDKYIYAVKHKDIPVAQLSPLCNALIEVGEYGSLDIVSVEEPVLKNWFTSYGYKSIFVRAVYDTVGEIIGFVSVEFILDKCRPEKEEYVIEETRRLADKVSVAIDLNLVKKEGVK